MQTSFYFSKWKIIISYQHIATSKYRHLVYNINFKYSEDERFAKGWAGIFFMNDTFYCDMAHWDTKMISEEWPGHVTSSETHPLYVLLVILGNNL